VGEIVVAVLTESRETRVVAYMPNVPKTLIAFLATASIGSVWATWAPEFGPGSVIARFGIVEDLAEVSDSLVVHLEDAEGGPGELILFVVLVDGRGLDEQLRTRIAAALRDALPPRHVPDAIEVVPAIPRTLT
jgi:acyl-coenzyme A synthetase/AMP-(fatty) acid ligase